MPASAPRRVERTQGFTLVEILVVISIIAVLAALLLGSLRGVRRSAGNVKCIANLRALAQLSAAWSADHDGFCPQGWWWATNLSVPTFPKANNLTAYGLTPAQSICPNSGFKVLSYGINAALVMSPSEIWGPGDRWFWDHGRAKMFQLSAKTILFAETSSTNRWAVRPGEGAYLARWDSIAGPHGNRLNIVYGDGHVGSESLSDMQKQTIWKEGLPDGL